MNLLKTFFWGWFDRVRDERERQIENALQNRDEEDEEWVWSGQMCSNVFWPDLCKDKNMSAHTYTHRQRNTHRQPIYYLLFYVTLWGKKENSVTLVTVTVFTLSM